MNCRSFALCVYLGSLVLWSSSESHVSMCWRLMGQYTVANGPDRQADDKPVSLSFQAYALGLCLWSRSRRGSPGSVFGAS